MLNFRSIKLRLIGLALALIMAGFLVRHYIALPILQQHVHDLAGGQQMAIASYLARDIDHSVTSRLNLISRLAADLPPALARHPERLNAWIAERQGFGSTFYLAFDSGLIALRPDGAGLLAEHPVSPGRALRDFSGAGWFQAALRAERAVLGKPARGPVSGDPTIVFAAPVRDPGGAVVLILAGIARLDAPGFLDRMQQTRLGETGGFLLISPADQLFVASSDPGMVMKPTPASGVNLLLDRAMAGFRGTGTTINARGVEELAAIAGVPSTGWFVVARMPTAEAFRAMQDLRSLMLKVSLSFLLVVVVVLALALPVILRPLTQAAHAMHDMADGKRKLEPLPVIRTDEVGMLVRGFNSLVARLHVLQAARDASEARLEFLAHHDSLTGLYNRAMLEDRLEQALARAERAGTQVALLFCDMDGFKPINDQYGHHVGDAVLRMVAERLSDERRRTDTVARLGGDEFVILLADLHDGRAAANNVAEQCLAAVSAPFDHEGKLLELGMSIGIALHAGPAVSPSDLISRADVAMYRAKHQGKGGYYFIDADAT